MTKGSICYEYITLIDIYSPNKGTPKYIKKKLAELILIDNNNKSKHSCKYIYVPGTIHALSCIKLFKHYNNPIIICVDTILIS